MSENLGPVLWSDFDGTVVEKLNPKNWHHWRRNIRKYPLAGLEGYSDFLHGIQDGDVELAGLVSRRIITEQRRRVTGRSMAELGLYEFFSEPEQVVLAGNESRKAQHVVNEARRRTVGMVDDAPHHFGPALLDALLETASASDEQNPLIALGIVAHDKAAERTTEFIDAANDLRPNLAITTHGDRSFIAGPHNNRFRLSVVQLEPYSFDAGQQFAREIYRV